MPQLRFRELSTNNNNAFNAGWIPFAAAVGTENGARSWLPVETLVKTATAIVTTAPTGAQSYDYQFVVGGVAGTDFTISAGETQDTGEHNTTLPAAIIGDFGGSSTRRHTIRADKNNTPPAQVTRYAFEYEVDGEDSLSWFQAGNGSDNITIASANDRFLTWDWNDNVGVTTTLATTQMPWPTSGKFKYFIIIPGITSLDEADFALQINGVDAIVFAVVGGTNQIDLTSEVPIEAGDLVNWRFRRTAGAGTTCAPLLVGGFIGE